MRRSQFRPGMSIELADGQPWVFPVPVAGTEPVDDGQAGDPELLELLDAIREAEDRAELLRAELALAIDLLGRNYHLSSGQLQVLLEFGPNDPGQLEARRAFHDLAVQVARQRRHRVPARPATPPTDRWVGMLTRWSARASGVGRAVGLSGVLGSGPRS